MISIATLLVAMGDLRNIISPLGYWIVWAGWLVISAFFSIIVIWKKSRDAGVWAVPSLIFGFFGLFLSFLLAAAINGDNYTAYQGTKFIAIASVGLFMFFYSRFLSPSDFYLISLFSIVASFLVFEYSRLLNPQWHIMLGDGRQGDIVAYPGVLWKVGAFFIPFLIARLTDERASKVIPSIGILLGVYLVFQDGSRTGFLWSALCMGVFLFVKITRARGLRLLVFLFGGCFLSIALAIVLFWEFGGTNSEPFPLAYNRLSEGDSVRSDMIIDGIVHAENCLPFGCGFGTAISTTLDGPMVVHNAFLSSAGDVGVIGVVSLIFLLIFPISMFIIRSAQNKTRPNYYGFAALMGVFGFSFLMLLHPLSTEMSEWGLYLIMTSWLHSLSKFKKQYGASI